MVSFDSRVLVVIMVRTSELQSKGSTLGRFSQVTTLGKFTHVPNVVQSVSK